MKSNIECGLCGAFLGNLHGNKQALAVFFHFKEVHPKELKEMKTKMKELKELVGKYKFNSDENYLR